jgi:cytoskeletal protein CcmA (bactofilin family)
MAFNEFRKGSTRELATSSPTSSNSGGSALTAFIDQGSEFSGKLSFKDTVRIDGRFEGEIRSENTLIVGETGVIDANIKSETVVVSGEVNGDVEARALLHLHKTARLNGNVKTRNLVVEEGAALNGQVDMSASAASARPEKTSAHKGDAPEAAKGRPEKNA